MNLFVRMLTLTTALLWLFLPAVRAAETVNEQVVAFCKGKIGEKVGSGQCTGLAEEALKAAVTRGYAPSPGAVLDLVRERIVDDRVHLGADD